MITKELISQVLCNHAGCLNLANQGNWLLGHPEKLLHAPRKKKGKDFLTGGGTQELRVGIERRQLQRVLLEFLYHRTVLDLRGNIDLLSCVLPINGKKPALQFVVSQHLDEFINLFHDKWYLGHRSSPGVVKGHEFLRCTMVILKWYVLVVLLIGAELLM